MGTLTLSEIKTRILKVLNEYSINGEVIGAADENRMDYDLRMNSLIDMHQRKIATTVKKISKSYVFTQYPPTNAIADPDDQFDIVPYEGTTLYYSGGQDAKSYYFEVDGDCTVTIQESEDGETWGGIVLTLTPEPTRFGLFTAYKGNINPTTDYYVRYKFEGDYAFNIRNIAFYTMAYPTDNDVPAYKDYRPYAMPSDFYQLRYILQNGQKADDKDYLKTPRWQLEGNALYIPWTETGEFRVHYWGYPTAINDSTLDTATLDIDDEATDAIIYGVAMDLIDDERKDAYRRIQNKYVDFVSRLDDKTTTGRLSIANRLFRNSTVNSIFS